MGMDWAGCFSSNYPCPVLGEAVDRAYRIGQTKEASCSPITSGFIQ